MTPTTPHEDDAARLRELLLSLGLEAWRLLPVLNRVLNKLDAHEQNRFAGNIRWFAKKNESALQEAGYRLLSYEGMPYDSGLPATPLNMDEFPETAKLYIARMVEPVVMDAEGRIVRSGTMILEER